MHEIKVHLQTSIIAIATAISWHKYINQIICAEATLIGTDKAAKICDVWGMSCELGESWLIRNDLHNLNSQSRLHSLAILYNIMKNNKW